ncbi:hypothetical protein ACTXT7_004393 [Hymenolepis weldensis]
MDDVDVISGHCMDYYIRTWIANMLPFTYTTQYRFVGHHQISKSHNYRDSQEVQFFLAILLFPGFPERQTYQVLRLVEKGPYGSIFNIATHIFLEDMLQVFLDHHQQVTLTPVSSPSRTCECQSLRNHGAITSTTISPHEVVLIGSRRTGFMENIQTSKKCVLGSESCKFGTVPRVIGQFDLSTNTPNHPSRFDQNCRSEHLEKHTTFTFGFKRCRFFICLTSFTCNSGFSSECCFLRSILVDLSRGFSFGFAYYYSRQQYLKVLVLVCPNLSMFSRKSGTIRDCIQKHFNLMHRCLFSLIRPIDLICRVNTLEPRRFLWFVLPYYVAFLDSVFIWHYSDDIVVDSIEAANIAAIVRGIMEQMNLSKPDKDSEDYIDNVGEFRYKPSVGKVFTM